MKRMIKAAEERRYEFSELSDTAKEHALDQQQVIDYLDDLINMEISEGLASLRYSLDSVECELIRGSFNYAISVRDYDIGLTIRGEDIFSVAGLDGSYQVHLPDAESDGLYVGEIFVSTFKDVIKPVKDDIKYINADILEYLNSVEGAEDDLDNDDDDILEINEFNESLYDAGQDYEKAVKSAADAAVEDLKSVIDFYSNPTIEDASYIFESSNFMFDIDGNVI